MTYYAHTRGLDQAEWQTVLQHLTGTADRARRLGADTGFAEFAATAAMFHDLGKYSAAFQRRLQGGAKVDHATAGAQEIDQLFATRGQAILGRLLAYCIAGHHSGLPDGGSPIDTADDNTLAARMKRDLEDYSRYSAEINTLQLPLPQRFPPTFRPIPGAPGFSVAFATRMIYSILVDADYLDTEAFCNYGEKPRGEYSSIPALAKQFSQYISRFDHPQREIDRQRSLTLHDCIAQASLPPGLFTLTLPTGAGKTLTSMAFAMQHAVQHGLKRIIYVIPYTSIIEQNAAVFRESFQGYEDHVLEHHSSFEWNPEHENDSFDGKDSALAKLKWAAENWDVPIIVTTNVQFFESLFASRNSRSRKIHNLAKSVIIFDEAQMLSREFMKPCIYSVVELVKNYGASAVFCTATQPALERFLPQGAQLHELIADPQAQFNFYRRVTVQKLGKLTDDQLLERLNNHPQVLCIVNTRKHAAHLFSGLTGEGCFHLSTLMCAAHRRRVITEIRQRLKAGLPCRVISTQLLEAGVDLDFPVGYRALAGLESINQSAGRVNREGKQATANLFLFEPDSEDVKRLPSYIKQTADVARVVLSHYADPICMDAIHEYYNLLYDSTDPAAFDHQHILECFEKGDNPPVFDFRTAAERFKLIADETKPVIVPFDDTARRLVEELATTIAPLAVLRKLQPYTVNIYLLEYEALEASGAIDIYSDAYAVLNARGEYDEKIGLIVPERRGGYGIIM